MKSLFYKLMLPALLALVMVACGGGGGFAGIGGSGYVSSGTVTGFGSVFVNGVEFDTSSATFEVEDTSASEQDLSIGMVVQVEGSINADGVTGTATRIHYGDDLEGPIASITANLNIKTLSVLGNTVLVDSNVTIFDGVTFDSLAIDSIVEISGYYDASNQLHASYVKFKSSSYDPSTVFEVTGPISGLSVDRFNLRGVTVDFLSASLSDLPNGLQNGLNVEVKGVLTNGILVASEIEGEEIDLTDDGSEVSVEGYITRFVSNSDFDINGYPINASSAVFEPVNLVLKLGLIVEAEGSISNGVLQATEIETRSGDAEVSAYVYDVDVVNKSFMVEVVAGQLVTVQMTTSTLSEDDVGTDNVLKLTELSIGNFVEVRGFETGTSTITATRIKRLEPAGIELQGVVTSQVADTSVTVLGVEFPVDASSTEFKDELEALYGNHTAFMTDTTDGQSVISIEDKAFPDGNDEGIADSVEIEIR